jgi:phospho-N-acetylmuramoyl-pentapeptide-transferase
MLGALFPPFVLGLLTALAAGWFLIPILTKLKARQTISTDAPKRHQTKAGTPTMGGAIIVVGVLIPALFYRPASGDVSQLRAVLLATLAFGAVGFLDDYLIVKRGKNLGLRAREKLLGQFIVAIAFAVWNYLTQLRPAFVASPYESWAPMALSVFHVLLMVGMSNAVNLTDGLDGLAAGVSLPVWICLAALGALWRNGGGHLPFGGVDQPGVVILCAAFAGATVGYLWYNAHPAQVFMGDTGSLAIGGGMAAAAIALRQEWLLLLAGLVHLVEAASVTLQVISFKTTGKRIFKMSPLHHHFELCEWPETRIVARFAIASALCAGAALSLMFWGS